MMMLATSLLALPLSSQAETPEEKGLAIAKEVERHDDGFGDFTANLEMILKNKQGDESRRTILIQTLEVKDDGDKSLSLFGEPADVKGTAMLTFSHKRDDDDQWMFLPALSRVKRIASGNKSGSFMGSEFAFEDIGSQEVEKYNYKYLRDEDLNSRPCFVIERYPVSPHSGYKRQVVWIDKAEYRVAKIDFYDRKDSLLKTLTMDGYEKYLQKYWRAGQMLMVNRQTEKTTLLKWTQFKFKHGLKDSDFTETSLKRAR
jgi:outer membrane lipoprotein-sorting protein